MAEYIERKAAIFPLYRWRNIIKNAHGENDEYVRCLTEAIEKIEDVPAADVAPVIHGHWILYKETVETTVFAGGHIYAKGDVVPYGYVCSECGRWEGNKEPFCNCGAKMEDES